MDVRPATEAADLDLLVELDAWVHDLHVERAPAVYRPTDPTELAGWFSELLATDGKEAWLAGTDGYVTLELQARPDTPFSRARRQLRVDQIAVRGDARRRGVGRALMALAERRARELGCARVVLDVVTFNAEAIAFYQALGFDTAVHRLARDVTVEG